MTLIVRYRQNDELPPNKIKGRWIKAKAARFYIIDGKPYKRNFSRPYLECIGTAEVEHVLAKLYDGECENHSRARSLAYSTLTTGDYRSTMRADSINHV